MCWNPVPSSSLYFENELAVLSSITVSDRMGSRNTIADNMTRTSCHYARFYGIDGRIARLSGNQLAYSQLLTPCLPHYPEPPNRLHSTHKPHLSTPSIMTIASRWMDVSCLRY